MPHQNVDADKATAQNAATDPAAPNDMARDQNVEARAEPRSYAAADVADASLAPPAAGEVSDYMDEGDATGGATAQSGRDRTNVSAHSRNEDEQGRKTVEGNRERLKDGSAS